MEAALRTRLLGLNPTQEISWVTRAQSINLPALTLQKVTPDRAYTMTGAGDLRGETVQIDIWGRSFSEVVGIRDSVIVEMEKTATADSIAFSPSFLTSERQSAEEVDGVGTVSRISIDFVVWWQPAN